MERNEPDGVHARRDRNRPHERSRVARRWARLAGALGAAAGGLALAGVAAAQGPAAVHQTPSVFAPVSAPAHAILNASWLLFGIVAAIFVSVEGALFYAVVRFRRRRGAGDERPPSQVYGSNPIEVAWTVVPLLIVTVLFLVTARIVFELQKTSVPPGAMHVTVVGHQWWWEFRYPDLGVVTANELHVPVSDRDHRRPVFLRLESADVIHSFWVPRLAGKTDVIPNRANLMWIEPFRTGTFVGQCSEYCGTQHAHMLLRVVVQPEDDFERWVAGQRQPAAPVPSATAQQGRAAFLSNACVKCHTIRGTAADGTFGPDLTHLMSRSTIGAGVARNDPGTLLGWIEDPDSLKPGVHMPRMGLGERQAEKIVQYLLTLH